MTFIDETKPLRNMLLEDDHDDIEFHPPQTNRDGAGSWKRKRQNFAFNQALAPDPKIDRMRDVWDRGNLFEEGGDAWFKTRAAVGIDDVNGQFDVAKSETLLDQAGVYNLKAVKGPTGIFSYFQQDAIKQYQTDNALRVDGRMAPNGETMRALKAQLTPKLNALAASAKAAKAAEAEKTEKAAQVAPVQPVETEKTDRIQLAQYMGDDTITNDAAPIGQFGPGRTGGPDHDRGDPPPRNDDQPDKQVAAAPALLAAAPVAARVALPWVIKNIRPVGRAVLGAVGGAAIGSLLNGGSKDDGKSGKREALPPGEMPPNHTGGDQLPPEDMKNNTETYPALDPVDLKNLTHIPGFTPSDVENIIEIFPADSGVRLPIIIESRGNEWTQEQNTKIAEAVVRWSKYLDRRLKHIGGAFDDKGTYNKEHYLENSILGGKKGSSRLDITLKNEKTDRLLHINTIDVKADGSTPSTREQNAAERILINMENGDILVLIPKLGKDQVLNHEGLEEFLKPLIEELGRDLSEIDLNDKAAPRNTINNFGKRGG